MIRGGAIADIAPAVGRHARQARKCFRDSRDFFVQPCQPVAFGIARCIVKGDHHPAPRHGKRGHQFGQSRFAQQMHMTAEQARSNNVDLIRGEGGDNLRAGFFRASYRGVERGIERR